MNGKERKISRSKRGKTKKAAFDVLFFCLVAFLAFLVMLPIWWMFRSSLMTNAELYAYPPSFFPSRWLFSNYLATLKHFHFGIYLKNTLTIIIPSVIGGTVTATMAGYAFGRLRFKGKNLLFSLCVGTMFLPLVVTLIPLYVMWTTIIGVTDSYLPLIIPHFCGGGAFNIFLIRQFVKTIPRELDEAATIDGAGYFRILTKIIVPEIRSAIIVVALLLFIFLWNDMLHQLVYINTAEKFTIAIGLNIFRSALRADWSKIMAATCLSFIPGLIIYLVAQRYFVEGIVMTGLKN